MVQKQYWKQPFLQTVAPLYLWLKNSITNDQKLFISTIIINIIITIEFSGFQNLREHMLNVLDIEILK